MKKVIILIIVMAFLSTACSWQKKSVYSGFGNDITLKADDNFEIIKIMPDTGSLGNDYSAYQYKWEDNDLYIKFVSTMSICEKIVKIEENLEANNINYAIYESNNQRKSGNYCDGISQYLIEFKLNDIERKDYNFIDTIGKGSRVIKADVESTYN